MYTVLNCCLLYSYLLELSVYFIFRHPALVCLCVRALDRKFLAEGLYEYKFLDWQAYVINELLGDVKGYSTFRRMVENFNHAHVNPSVKDALNLLRVYFLPNFNLELQVSDKKEICLASFLAKEGVLKVVDENTNTYVISSQLMRSLFIHYVLPNVSSSKPSFELPRFESGRIDWLRALIIATSAFEPDHIRMAAQFSFKTAGGCVNGNNDKHVPRESV